VRNGRVIDGPRHDATNGQGIKLLAAGVGLNAADDAVGFRVTSSDWRCEGRCPEFESWDVGEAAVP
jgi:hypothetical protein